MSSDKPKPPINWKDFGEIRIIDPGSIFHVHHAMSGRESRSSAKCPHPECVVRTVLES